MTSPKYNTTVLKVAVHLARENPVFGEHNTEIIVEDDAAGPFFILRQHHEDQIGTQEIRLDFEELDEIFKACDVLRQQKTLMKELQCAK